MQGKCIVGTNILTYNSLRNFAGLDFAKYQIEKKMDLFRVPSYIYFRLINRAHPILLNLHKDFDFNRCQLLHFFNALSLDKTPWVTTFEYFLPRWSAGAGAVKKRNYLLELGFGKMASSSCKKLIAMSHHAYRSQLRFLDDYPSFRDEIDNKICIIHPPQKIHINSYEEKILPSEYVSFTIVGGDFFRKGGFEVLRAFSRVVAKGYPISLNIVSSLAHGDYASRSTEEDVKECQSIIERFQENIRYYKSLSNKDVVELFKTSDVGLLPSYDESYGYTALEAQACGCPVVTTNGGALAEINNEQVGWLIEVPLVEDNRSVPRTKEAKRIFSEKVEASLELIFIECCENREIIVSKGSRSLDRIREEHDPLEATQQIERIYDEAMS